MNPGKTAHGLKREDSLGFHGGLTERAILAALEKELRPFGMSPVQYIAMGWILSGFANSPTDLAETLSVTKATAVRLIDRMVRDGLVTRESDAKDGRVKVLRPSRKAETVWKQVADVGPRNLRRAYRGIEPADIETVKRVLARVRENLRK